MTITFVHVPKTAGTSFRKSFCEVVDRQKIQSDYSEISPDTSKEVRELVFEQKDLWLYRSFLELEGIALLSGHFDVQKYLRVLGCQRMVSFVRNPIGRLVSEYKHFVRNYNYAEDFETFYRNPQFINKQARIIQGVPIPALGFVGVTERYSESIEVFNWLFGYELPELKLNQAGAELEDFEVSQSQLEEIQQLNAKDIVVYNECVTWFERMHACWEAKQKPVRGWIGHISESEIIGAAWNSGEDAPVSLELLVNKESIASINAVEYREHLHLIGVPRGGYVGFSWKFAEPLLNKGDIVSLRCKSTGQLIFGSPLIFGKPKNR